MIARWATGGMRPTNTTTEPVRPSVAAVTTARPACLPKNGTSSPSACTVTIVVSLLRHRSVGRNCGSRVHDRRMQPAGPAHAIALTGALSRISIAGRRARRVAAGKRCCHPFARAPHAGQWVSASTIARNPGRCRMTKSINESGEHGTAKVGCMGFRIQKQTGTPHPRRPSRFLPGKYGPIAPR